jgi:hypothetical protein
LNIDPPVYIGRDIDNVNSKAETWCFYAFKNGVGRFVKYINYPFWAVGSDMPSRFDLSVIPPPNVLEDVELFITDKVTFHELPRKQGRRNRIIRTIVGDGGSLVAVSGRENPSSQPVQGSDPGRGSGTDAGRVPDAGTGTSTGSQKVRRRRRRVHPDVPESSGGSGVRSVPSEPRVGVCAVSGRMQDLDTGQIVGHVDDIKPVEAAKKLLKRARKLKNPVIPIVTSTGRVDFNVVEELKQVVAVAEVAAKALPTPEPIGVETVAKRKPGRPKRNL